MNRLLKNTGGQLILFFIPSPAGGGASGLTPGISLDLDGGAFAGGTNAVTEIAGGWYSYPPSIAETNGDLVGWSVVPGSSLPGLGEVIRTEASYTAIPDVTLAAAQPHYAPSKAGDAMALVAGQDIRNILGTLAGTVQLAAAQPNYAPAKVGDPMTLAANQDVRNVLGNVVGNVAGDILGTVDGSGGGGLLTVAELLDSPNAVGAGLTLRQAFGLLLASLVNISVNVMTAVHVGPTSVPITPKFDGDTQETLGQATAALLAVIELSDDHPNDGILSTAQRAVLHQVATAIDAIRTQSE